MMKKRMTAGMLATLMAAVLPVSACAAQNSAPQPQLNTAEHMQYMNGYTDGTFGPERSMSRSEAAAIFARLLSDRLDERIPSGNNVKFKDIDPDMWYAGYVEYLTGYGVAVGYNDRTYRGDKAITRAEFTAMAARFFDVYGDGAEEIMEQYEGFDDVSDGYWAAEYINCLLYTSDAADD